MPQGTYAIVHLPGIPPKLVSLYERDFNCVAA